MKAPAWGLLAWALVTCALSVALAAQTSPASNDEAESVPTLDIQRVYIYEHEGAIHGVPARMLRRAIETATSSDSDLFLLEINTPGGEGQATEEMVMEILNSPIPVCVYVTPRGGHAASAGFFLLMAADVAAMTPLTRTGAASPVWQGSENKGDDVLFRKVSQDMAALVRATAEQRNRPPDLAEKAVLEATTWTSGEALEVGLVDLIADDRDELFSMLNGREIVRGDGSLARLQIEGTPETFKNEIQLTESIESVLFHPAALSLYLAIGMLGLYIELTNPGLIYPGVVGAICLALVFLGSRGLPANAFAIGLLVLGVVFFLLELKIVSFGLLSIAGGISLAAGLYFLFPSAAGGSAVPMYVLAPVVLLLVGGVASITWVVRKTMRQKPASGREGLIGKVGEATSDLAHEGTIFIHGEVWSARSERPVRKGQSVKVVAVEGLRLVVTPVVTLDENSHIGTE